MLADEPSGNLDHNTALSTYDLMRELNREYIPSSFLVVTHDGELRQDGSPPYMQADGLLVNVEKRRAKCAFFFLSLLIGVKTGSRSNETRWSVSSSEIGGIAVGVAVTTGVSLSARMALSVNCSPECFLLSRMGSSRESMNLWHAGSMWSRTSDPQQMMLSRRHLLCENYRACRKVRELKAIEVRGVDPQSRATSPKPIEFYR